MLKNRNIISGFTLIELLVVISILGILATIGLVAFQSSQARGRDAERKSDLKQIASALELYYSDYGKYPSSSSGQIDGCPSTSQTPCVWGSGEFRDVAADNTTKTTYFKVLPKDPSSTYKYVYIVDGTNQKFQLFAYLENSQDASIISTTQICGTTQHCNFAITSPNTNPADTTGF